eukprot:gene1410-2014_t
MAQEATLTVRERFMRLRLAELAMMQLTTTLAKSQKVCPCTDLRGPCPHTCPKRVRADPRSMTPVKLCIHHKDIHLAKEIITGRHGDVQEPCGGDDVGSSFFSTALLSGESEFLEWLLTDSNVDPKYTSESMLNLPDRFGYTPANKAAVNGYTNVIQLMQAKSTIRYHQSLVLELSQCISSLYAVDSEKYDTLPSVVGSRVVTMYFIIVVYCC